LLHNIALQESKEGAHCNQVEALWVKFAAAAELKSTTKEKRVILSSQKTHLDQGSLDNKMEGTVTNGVPADNRPQPKQGSQYPKSLKLSRLAPQVTEQERLAATANLLACSFRTQGQRDLALPVLTQEGKPQVGDMYSPTIAQGAHPMTVPK
jgi:hypothetical protein